MAFTGAFTGGLFNSIALILLLPRASYFFSRHFDDNKLHYPWAYLISVLSFSVIMFIEKVAPDHSDYNIENVDNVCVLCIYILGDQEYYWLKSTVSQLNCRRW